MARYLQKIEFFQVFRRQMSIFVNSSVSQTHDWRPLTWSWRFQTPTVLSSALLRFWIVLVIFATESFSRQCKFSGSCLQITKFRRVPQAKKLPIRLQSGETQNLLNVCNDPINFRLSEYFLANHQQKKNPKNLWKTYVLRHSLNQYS